MQRGRLLLLTSPRLARGLEATLDGTGLKAAISPVASFGRRTLRASLRRHLHDEHPYRGVLVVTSSPGVAVRAIQGPCTQGIPTGIVVARRPRDLDAWIDGLRCVRHPSPKMGVMSMWKPFYLAWGERFARSLRRGYGPLGARVGLWGADRVYSESLCARLARGVGLGVYAGHGRVRGWSGYRGLRWSHVEAVRQVTPQACIIALACDTLNFNSGRGVPFGARWVMSGRCASYLAPASSVPVEPLEPIGDIFATAFRRGRSHTLAALVREVESRVRALGRSDVLASWQKFRILGNPLQRFI